MIGTLVTIEVPAHMSPLPAGDSADAAIGRAFGWFRHVERGCSRFDATSELVRLTQRPHEAVEVSALLFEAVGFALEGARETDGAFDPTIGLTMERMGFDREYRTGRRVATLVDRRSGDRLPATWREVLLDADRSTITLLRPLLLDLGAVAKGLAVDLAARELEPLRHFAIDAGGDLYVSGDRDDGAPWSIGIRHPQEDARLLDCVRVRDFAVCTSGNYERQREHGLEARHIVDPRTGSAPHDLLSVTVAAPSAMLADALATAAFVLGVEQGGRLLEAYGASGLLCTSSLGTITTGRWGRDDVLGR